MRAVGTEIVSRSGLLPQLSGTANYTRTLRSQYDGLFTSSSSGQGAAASQNLPFGQQQPVHAWGSTSRNSSSTAARRWPGCAPPRRGGARRRSTSTPPRAETLLDVTSAYFDALLSDRLVTIAEASLAQQEEILRQTDVAFQVGDKSEFEQLQARVSRDNQVPQVLQSRSRRQEAYLRLKQLLNVPLEDERPPHHAAGGAAGALRQPLGPLGGRPGAGAPGPGGGAGQPEPARRRAGRALALDLPELALQPGGLPRERLPAIRRLPGELDGVAQPLDPHPHRRPDRGDELVARGNLSAGARRGSSRPARPRSSTCGPRSSTSATPRRCSRATRARSSRRSGGYEIAQLRFREGISSQIELQNARLLFEQAEVNRAQALRNVQVARARLALIRDLPLTTAGSQATAQVSGASTGAAALGMPAQTSQPGTSTGTAPTARRRCRGSRPAPGDLSMRGNTHLCPLGRPALRSLTLGPSPLRGEGGPRDQHPRIRQCHLSSFPLSTEWRGAGVRLRRAGRPRGQDAIPPPALPPGHAGCQEGRGKRAPTPLPRRSCWDPRTRRWWRGGPCRAARPSPARWRRSGRRPCGRRSRARC